MSVDVALLCGGLHGAQRPFGCFVPLFEVDGLKSPLVQARLLCRAEIFIPDSKVVLQFVFVFVTES